MAKRPTAYDVLSEFELGQARPGQARGLSSADDAVHFYLCPACGQPVDMRDIAAVFHHEDPDHEQLPPAEAVALVAAADMRPDNVMQRIAARVAGTARDYRLHR